MGTMELDRSSCRCCEGLTSKHLSLLDPIPSKMGQARYISDDKFLVSSIIYRNLHNLDFVSTWLRS